MYLQLAEGQKAVNLDNYIKIPDGAGGWQFAHIRMFDDMPMRKFEEMLDYLEPYQPQAGQLSAGGRDWRAQKRESKLARQAAKTATIQSRATLRNSKAGAIDRGDKPEGIGGVLNKALDTVGGIFGKKGSDQAAAPQGNERFNVQVEGGNQPPPEEEKTFLEKYGIWIGVGAVVLVGGYFLLKN